MLLNDAHFELFSSLNSLVEFVTRQCFSLVNRNKNSLKEYLKRTHKKRSCLFQSLMSIERTFNRRVAEYAWCLRGGRHYQVRSIIYCYLARASPLLRQDSSWINCLFFRMWISHFSSDHRDELYHQHHNSIASHCLPHTTNPITCLTCATVSARDNRIRSWVFHLRRS